MELYFHVLILLFLVAMSAFIWQTSIRFDNLGRNTDREMFSLVTCAPCIYMELIAFWQ